MFQVHLSSATFAQPSKYVIILKNNQQTKRSQVCSLWTSVPHFDQPILIDTLDGLVVKACTATIDRKLTVLGGFEVKAEEVNMKNGLVLQEEKQFVQVVEGKEVCIGNCKIKIIRKHLQKQQKLSHQEIDEDFQLKQQSESQSEDGTDRQKSKLKFIFHGGYDFYLNAGFKICVCWGAQKQQTKQINNRIAPFWGEVINMQGSQKKIIEIVVRDDKGNKLQWMKIDVRQIRIMYPYHLHVTFRQEYVGLNPHFYMTIIKEDVPRFSVVDNRVNFLVKYIGPVAAHRSHQYLLIYPKQIQQNTQNRLPLFIDLDMNNYLSFETINKQIQQRPDKNYEWSNWNLLIPVNISHQQNTGYHISLLKSFLNRSLVCMYFTLDDTKSLFCGQVWNGVNVVERRENFENSIKELYYQEKKISMGKAVELLNADNDELEVEEGDDLEERWKILTHNYILRKKLLTKSINNTELMKNQIKQKGQYLEHLKKTLIDVKKMNAVMVEKQRSALLQNRPKLHQKIRENWGEFHTTQIITVLLEKQVELEKRKKINDEMRMRMDSLHYFNEDSEQLNRIVVQNANRLLEQQIKVKQMKKMRESLPKQREVILKLQKMFESRQIDKEMNQLLSKQQNKLSEMKKTNNTNLQAVFNIVKGHGNAPHSLKQNIQQAERELIKLNAYYAKLTTQ